MPSSASTSWQNAVRSGDRRRVEVGDRGREPVAPALDQPVGLTLRQQRDHLVGRPARRPASDARELLLGRDQPLANALTQLARRHPCEGHQQQLVQRRAGGDEARRQCGDRERLAGAGARLEHRHTAAAARPVSVERGDAGRLPGRRCRPDAHCSSTIRARAAGPRAAWRDDRGAIAHPAAQPGPLVARSGRCRVSSSNVSSAPNASRCSGSAVLAVMLVARIRHLGPRPGSRVLERGAARRPPVRRRRPCGTAAAAAPASRASRRSTSIAEPLERPITPRVGVAGGHRYVGDQQRQLIAGARTPDRDRLEPLLRMGRRQRQQAHPGGQPVPRVQP